MASELVAEWDGIDGSHLYPFGKETLHDRRLFGLFSHHPDFLDLSQPGRKLAFAKQPRPEQFVTNLVGPTDPQPGIRRTAASSAP